MSEIQEKIIGKMEVACIVNIENRNIIAENIEMIVRKDERKRCIEAVNLAIDEFKDLCGETAIVKYYIKQVIKNKIEKPQSEERGLGD